MNQILAALIFFTRLPFWKIKEVPQECFKHVVSYWSFSGWLTGGMMALIFWGASTILPHGVAVILALTSRLLITGALHEDGLADFFDGFGGGTNRESTLRIMKDSHIGSYGVLGFNHLLSACLQSTGRTSLNSYSFLITKRRYLEQIHFFQYHQLPALRTERRR